MTTQDRVNRIIAEQLGVSNQDMRPTANLVIDYGADSLDLIELCMALEEEFEMAVPDEDAEKIVTVQDILDYLTKHSGVTATP